jgi:DNA-binding beta-propeller fold protein YncE
VLFSPDGSKLVGTRVATSLIDSFVVDGDGLLVAAAGSPFAAQGLSLLQSTPLNAPAVTPEDARLSPDGSTLWVVDPGADAISGFTVSGGSLTELSSAPTPAPVGAAPTGIVVT